MHQNLESELEEAISRDEPLKVYEHFIRQNDLDFLNPELSSDRRAVNQRTLIHKMLMRKWFRDVLNRAEYSGPASCIFIGGAGRDELTPYSDIDTAFLIGDKKEGDKLKVELERSIEKFERKDPFRDLMGFSLHSEYYFFEDASNPAIINALQVNSLCDSSIIVDQGDYANRFLSEVFQNRKVFSHLEHNVKSWNEITRKHERGTDNLNAFDIKEDIGGLRHLQAALRIPTLGRAQPLNEAYKSLLQSNPEVLDAYNYLLWLRGWLHLHKGDDTQHKLVDTITYNDFAELGREIGHWAQERLIDSRIIIENYSDSTITRALKKGYHHNGVTYGPLGIYSEISDGEWEKMSDTDKNRTLARFLRVSQEDPVSVDIDSFISRFGDASKWASPSKEFADLFFLPGLGRSLFLLRKARAYNKVIPGAEEFESSIPSGGHRIQYLTKTAFGRQKVLDFEKKISEKSQSVGDGRCDFHKLAESLTPLQIGAIKIAYNTAGMPSFKSVSPREYYYSQFSHFFEGGIPPTALEEVIFLVENRELLRETAMNDLSSEATVRRIASAAGSKDRLDMLRAYTEVDLHRKPENYHLWPFIDEIYNSVSHFLDHRERGTELEKRYSEEQLEIISGFGAPLRGSIYYPTALKWSPKFLRVAKSKTPEAQLSWTQDGLDLYLSCPDFEGLLGIVSGNCYKSYIGIKQLHTYTSKDGLVFDVFNLGTIPRELNNDAWTKSLVADLSDKRFIDDDPKEVLKNLELNWKLQRYEEADLLRLSFDSPTKIGTVYSLTRGLYLSVGANIYAARSWKEDGQEFYRMFFRPNGLDFDSTQRSLERFFNKQAI